MIDSSAVGKEWPSYTAEVEKGDIRRFAEAIGDDNAVFRKGDIVAPPTFATCFRGGEFTVLDDLGVDMKKLLHAEQEYEFGALIRPGDVLTCTPSVASVKTKETKKGTMTFLTTQVKVTNAANEMVCLAKSTVAIRE